MISPEKNFNFRFSTTYWLDSAREVLIGVSCNLLVNNY